MHVHGGYRRRYEDRRAGPACKDRGVLPGQARSEAWAGFEERRQCLCGARRHAGMRGQGRELRV
eukprot:364783-Chlamydomonas_euryale.AAC.16